MKSITARAWLFAGVMPLVLSGCVWKSDYDALQTQNQQLQAQNQQLQQQNAAQSAELSASREHVARLQHAITYTVNSDLLFRSGSWEMTPRGKSIIGKMARKLGPSQVTKVMVSGYTDNTPIGPRLKEQGVTTNQELSQKRAEAVMQFLVSQGAKPELVSAQGFGEADPVASNDSAQGRAKNRRVVLSTVGDQAAEGSSATH